MELYTLDSNFLLKDPIDEFQSVIWTERFSDIGDATLVVPENLKNHAKLPEGSMLWTPDSKEIMYLETQSIEEGLITMSGKSLTQFLDERVIRASDGIQDTTWLLEDMTPGQLIAYIVEMMCATSPYTNGTIPTRIDLVRQKIPNFSIGNVDSSGDYISVSVPYGPVLGAIQEIANTYNLGMSITLDHATDAGYLLYFNVWKGFDRSNEVRFSASMDTFVGEKELRSISGYKNIAYAFATGYPDADSPIVGVAYGDGMSGNSTGFNRRVLMLFVDDLTDIDIDEATLQAILDQKAKDGLANNNYTRVLDGEVISQKGYTYGVDYYLGDIVSLEARGLTQKARITEYIRSQDNTGERAYPTVSVID